MGTRRSRKVEKRFFIDNDIIREYGQQLGPYGIRVYAALCLHADIDSQECFPSHATIAKLTGMSVSSVKKNVKKLVELELVRVSKQVRKKGGHTSNLYTLLTPPSLLAPGPQAGGTRAPRRGAANNNPNNEQSSPDPGPFEKDKNGSAGDDADRLRTDWRVPYDQEQVEFLGSAGWDSFQAPGQRRSVAAILRAVRAGDELGEKVYEVCARELEDRTNLSETELPPLPRSWFEAREQRETPFDGWIPIQRTIECLLDRDRLVAHCRAENEEERRSLGPRSPFR
jgi:hypothetical protein